MLPVCSGGSGSAGGDASLHQQTKDVPVGHGGFLPDYVSASHRSFMTDSTFELGDEEFDHEWWVDRFLCSALGSSWFLSVLQSAMVQGYREPPYPCVLTDATMERLALTKFVSQECSCEVRGCPTAVPLHCFLTARLSAVFNVHSFNWWLLDEKTKKDFK